MSWYLSISKILSTNSNFHFLAFIHIKINLYSIAKHIINDVLLSRKINFIIFCFFLPLYQLISYPNALFVAQQIIIINIYNLYPSQFDLAWLVFIFIIIFFLLFFSFLIENFVFSTPSFFSIAFNFAFATSSNFFQALFIISQPKGKKKTWK